MPAKKFNDVIEQGATYKLTITYKTSLGALFDLTGYKARMQIRQTHETAATIFDKTEADPEITLGAELGTIVIQISDETTAAFPKGSFVYDLELEDLVGDVVRLIEGAMTITPEVTR